MSRDLRDRGDLAYWPVRSVYLLILAGAFAFAVVAVQVVGYAYGRLGLSPFWAYSVLVACLLGSRVNVAVRRLPGQVERVEAVVVVFGVPYVVPAVARVGETVIAINVGGALVPCALAAYLWIHTHAGWQALGAVAIVTLVTAVAARRVPGVGIVVPTLVPPMAAVTAALVLGGPLPAALAYIGGTLGTVIGADLFHLHGARRLGAPVLSIGGAGTFDGIFVTGIIAVLLAAV